MATPYESLIYNKERIYPGAGFEILSSTSITGPTTLTGTEGRFILVDTTSAPFTISLPATPYQGMTYWIGDGSAAGSFTMNNLTIFGNGQNINGASSLVLNANFSSRTLYYIGTAWLVVGRGIA